MPFEFTLREFQEAAERAKAQFEQRRGKMRALRDSNFFSFPVCSNAEDRMKTVLSLTPKGSKFMHSNFPRIVFGEIATLRVRGIARWIDDEPDEATLSVLIKNPRDSNAGSLWAFLGVRNALVRVGNRLLLGGVAEDEVYIIRPVAKKYAHDLLKKIG